MHDLRQRFLTEGEKTCMSLLDRSTGAWDARRAKEALHQWAGLGGMLGCPEITAYARKLERLLEIAPERCWPLIVEGLEELTEMFRAKADDPVGSPAARQLHY